MIATSRHFIRQLPGRFFRAVREIDDEAALERKSQAASDYGAAIVLITATFSLILGHYLAHPRFFYRMIEALASLTGLAPGKLGFGLIGTRFSGLTLHLWWAISLLVAYALLPVLVIKIALRESLRSYGLGIPHPTRDLKWYVLLAAAMLTATVLSSSRSDFVNYYPFYRMAYRSWADLLSWEAIYLSQFAFVEFFFRGFLLLGCRRACGSNAIFVMCLPYVMIHFPKPWPEALGSLAFGLLIGALVLRSRSIWGAVVIHCCVALTMDLLALLHGQGLPTRSWP